MLVGCLKGCSVSVDQLPIGQSLWKIPSNTEIALLKISSGMFITWCTTATELVCCWFELDEAVLLDDVDVDGVDWVEDLAEDAGVVDDWADLGEDAGEAVEDEDWEDEGVGGEDGVEGVADWVEDEGGTDDWDDVAWVVCSVDGVEGCCRVEDGVDGEDWVDGAGDCVEDWADDNIDNEDVPELPEWVESPA